MLEAEKCAELGQFDVVAEASRQQRIHQADQFRPEVNDLLLLKVTFIDQYF